ncbi:MAG: DUF1761 domain-containing protein [Proteobacteria bacterium]|nr:DUF1761 domain-containing protein [Pseudomonadota bacterium]
MINWLGVGLSVLAVFLIGGPWYGPLFGKAWMKASGLSEEMKGGHKGVVFGGAAVAGLIAAIALNFLIGPEAGLMRAVTVGLAAGVGLVTMSFVINYLFAARTMALLVIDGAYNIVLFAVMGVIFGALG